MAEEFKEIVEKAVKDRQIAGGAAIAIGRDGETLFQYEFGNTSVDETAKPFKFDTTFWIASSTKLLTSICALQCVEKGLLKLDDDISELLPVWKNPKILAGFDNEGKPQLVEVKQKITLRRLLTHSSGMTYDFMSPDLAKYRAYHKLQVTGTIDDMVNPLVFEPGTSWQYGVGIDWAGHLVEKVTGLQLGDYMQSNIFAPLDMKSTTFDPIAIEDVMKRMTGRVARNAAGELIKDETEMFLVKSPKAHLGGGGGYSCAGDYSKVVTSLLLNDGKLLGPKGYEEAFKGQLENPNAFTETVASDLVGGIMAPAYGGHRKDTKWNYSLVGALLETDIPGLASKGTIFWSGLPNNYWFVDRQNGVAGYYAGWLLPPGDPITGKMFQALQKAAVKEGAKL